MLIQASLRTITDGLQGSTQHADVQWFPSSGPCQLRLILTIDLLAHVCRTLLECLGSGAQDAEWFEAKKSRQGGGRHGANGYSNGRPPPAPQRPAPVVNELDEDETDITDATIEALGKGAGDACFP